MLFRDRFGKLSCVRYSSGKTLADGRERIGRGLLDIDTFRRAFSVNECRSSEKFLALVIYCKYAQSVASSSGKPAPKIMVFVDDAQDAALFARELNARRPKSLFLTEILSLEARSLFVEQFVYNDTDVLICTDAGVVGLQMPDVDHVVHLDLPSKANLVQFGIRSRFCRKPDIASGNQLGGHIHMLFDANRDQDVGQSLVDYINKHQVGPVPLSSIY